MYINKMIFLEQAEVENLLSEEELQCLKERNIITHTDYNTVEIVADVVNYYIGNFYIIQTLRKCLGQDVLKLILSNQIDFIMLV